MITVSYDIKFGVHSNIPICCIEAYVTDNMPLISGRVWGYRPCWECYTKDIQVEIHLCTSGCKNFLRSIGLTSERFLKGLKTKKEMKKWKTQTQKDRTEIQRK